MEPEIGHQDYSQLSCRMKVQFLILTINIYIVGYGSTELTLRSKFSIKSKSKI